MQSDICYALCINDGKIYLTIDALRLQGWLFRASCPPVTLLHPCIS